MSSLDAITDHQTALGADETTHLQALIADWQIIADLSFSDLVLWLPDSNGTGFWVGAQVRPNTNQTTLVEDFVGRFVVDRPRIRAVFESGVANNAAVEDHVRFDTFPVRHRGVVIAVVERRSSAQHRREQSALEEAYLDSSATLVSMIASGEFPPQGERSELADSLRVGDGFIRLDAEGTVTYASPNAHSAYLRVGLTGELTGANLAEVTRRLSAGRLRVGDSGAVPLAATGESQETELENDRGTVILRAIPLMRGGTSMGTIVLLREVTDLRRRELQLMSREATIREIHHRVKNNLQTVAALLRLQSRRMTVPEAKVALDEAMHRIGSIALVHETLSQSFDEHVEFDEIADQLLATVPDVAAADTTITTARSGSFGIIGAEVATRLSMVITEVIQNSAQHAFDGGTGHIALAVIRVKDRLRFRISDDGRGLPDDFDSSASLGLSIVRGLVESELGGTIEYSSGRSGTTVEVCIDVD